MSDDESTTPGNESGAVDVEALRAELAQTRENLAKARKWEDKYKAVVPQIERATALEGEVTALKESLATTSSSAADAAQKLSVMSAALKNGLGDGDLVFLSGIPEEKLDEAAATLAKRFRVSSTPNFEGGARGTAPTAPIGMGEFLSQAIGNARRR